MSWAMRIYLLGQAVGGVVATVCAAWLASKGVEGWGWFVTLAFFFAWTTYSETNTKGP